jgi:hypothetical protein
MRGMKTSIGDKRRRKNKKRNGGDKTGREKGETKMEKGNVWRKWAWDERRMAGR